MKNLIAKLKAVDKGTIIRTLVFILAIINQVVAFIGASSFADATWYQVLSIVVTAVVSAVAAWKNNDWTYFARLGTKVLNGLRDGKLTYEEVIELLKNAGYDEEEINKLLAEADIKFKKKE